MKRTTKNTTLRGLAKDYTEEDKTFPLSGLFGLQIHGGGKAEAAYKELTVEELR